MASAIQSASLPAIAVPETMTAAVYRGTNDVRIETLPVPRIGAGELLLRVHTCGICGTDLKKIFSGSHSAPRIFGHEISGAVVAMGPGVGGFKYGDRVTVFHHILVESAFIASTRFSPSVPFTKR